jgi:hypothetical protein
VRSRGRGLDLASVDQMLATLRAQNDLRKRNLAVGRERNLKRRVLARRLADKAGRRVDIQNPRKNRHHDLPL